MSADPSKKKAKKFKTPKELEGKTKHEALPKPKNTKKKREADENEVDDKMMAEAALRGNGDPRPKKKKAKIQSEDIHGAKATLSPDAASLAVLQPEAMNGISTKPAKQKAKKKASETSAEGIASESKLPASDSKQKASEQKPQKKGKAAAAGGEISTPSQEPPAQINPQPQEKKRKKQKLEVIDGEAAEEIEPSPGKQKRKKSKSKRAEGAVTMEPSTDEEKINMAQQIGMPAPAIAGPLGDTAKLSKEEKKKKKKAKATAEPTDGAMASNAQHGAEISAAAEPEAVPAEKTKKKQKKGQPEEDNSVLPEDGQKKKKKRKKSAAGQGLDTTALQPASEPDIQAAAEEGKEAAKLEIELADQTGEEAVVGPAETRKGTAAKAFQRVKAEEWLHKKAARDNSYKATFGSSGWGAKAQEVLGQVRGKDFRHEKTKKKRGSYRGGVIDNTINSFKFESDDD